MDSGSNLYQSSNEWMELDFTQSSLQDQELHEDVILQKIVPLNTTQDSGRPFFREVSYLFHSNDQLIIGDKKLNQVSRFSADGVFMNQIGSLGRGPGEFISLEGLDYDSDKNTIFLYSNSSKRILQYDLSGKFLSEQATNFSASQFKLGPDHTYFFFDSYSYQEKPQKGLCLFQYDRAMNLVSSSVSLQTTWKHDMTEILAGFYPSTGSSFLMVKPLCDTILRITDQQIQSAYVTKWPECGFSNIPQQQLAGNVMGYLLGSCSLQKPIVEGEDFLIFSYLMDNERQTGIYNKHSKSLHLSKDYKRTSLARLFFRPIAVVNANTFVTPIWPNWYQHYLEEDPDLSPYLKQHYPGLYNILSSSQESAPPILVYFTLSS
ncbi:MAG: 6-bladed beta-propeller [Bacteroidota bacterium]